MVEYNFVNSKSTLRETASRLETEEAVAVDLEADSMFHFREKVCLIQMASKNHTAVIDPLAIEDLSPLKPLFASRSIRKILHGSDYDIRSLHRDHNIVVNNLFDTELASRFMGATETGLSAVLKNRFGVSLDKSFQKKDWSRRPLPSEMIEYGVSDVVYLLSLAEALDRELAAKHRTGWVREECELLSQVRVPQYNGTPLFTRIKGAGRLDRRSLGTLENLLKLRMKLAEKKDRPLFKVIGNNTLIKLAKERPLTSGELYRLHILSPRQSDALGESILRTIRMSASIPDEELPVYPRKKRPALKPDIPVISQAIKTWRDNRAAELELDPPILFNKALLTAIAVRKPQKIDDMEDIEGLRQWQKDEFGDEILQVLKTV